jgi:hypothetical protein
MAVALCPVMPSSRRLLLLLLPAAAAGCSQNSAGPDDPRAEACPAPLAEATVAPGSDRFARALAAGPDADGDGHPDVVVGEPSTLQSADTGAVYLISGATGQILRTWQAESVGDAFGRAVSLGPDADGDGRADVLVGAPEFDGLHGRVYLYSGASGALLHQWDGEAFAELGGDVSLGPDADGDGLGDAVFSDDFEYDITVDGDIQYSKRGRVFLESGATGALIRRFDADPAARSGNLGNLAQLGRDVDHDGRGDVLATGSAGVQLFSGATGALLRTFSADDSSYEFGSAASLGPDTDGDGVADVVIAMAATTGHEELVKLYSGATGEILQTWRSDNWRVIYGHRLALAPDLDGDGHGDVVLAADMVLAGADEPATTVFVFSGASADAAPLASWSHAEHRGFITTGAAALPDGSGCGGLVAFGIVEDDPLDGPLAAHVELRRIP